jgi:hypothetical protein
MKRIAEALAKALLEHHREFCQPHSGTASTVTQQEIRACVISYGDLCKKADYPCVAIGCGRHLVQVAEWCYQNNFPPLNSLAVNKRSKTPGRHYSRALGCDAKKWHEQVSECIAFKGYPATPV